MLNVLRPIEVRVVQTTDEFREASHLVYLDYVRYSRARTNAAQLKLSIYHALPTTTTFIARHRRGSIIGTLSLIEDSPCGLPMDESYKAELDVLRKRKLRLAEATMLAGQHDSWRLTTQLFQVVLDYLRSCTQSDELVTVLDPTRQLLDGGAHPLQPLGILQPSAGGTDAQHPARHLFITATRCHPRSPESFAKKLRFSSDDLRLLFVVLSPVFASASRTELDYLKSCYPTYDFTTILQPATRVPVA